MYASEHDEGKQSQSGKHQQHKIEADLSQTMVNLTVGADHSHRPTKMFGLRHRGIAFNWCEEHIVLLSVVVDDGSLAGLSLHHTLRGVFRCGVVHVRRDLLYVVPHDETLHRTSHQLAFS